MMRLRSTIEIGPCQAAARCLVGLITAVCLLTLPSLFGLSVLHAQSFLEVENFGNIDFGTWIDSGSFSTGSSLCIASANTSFWLPWRGSQRLDYTLKVTSLDSTGSHYLYRDGNASATGNERIAIDFSHQDLLGGGGLEALAPDQFDQVPNTGQFRYCFFGGANAQLNLQLPAAQLEQAANGFYSGTFRLEASNGGAADSIVFSVSIIVQGGPEVRISALDNLNLGSYGSGRTGDLSASERFCVYSNEGNYRLTVSSPNQDSGGNFQLTSSGTGDAIPMEILFIDSGVGTGTVPVTNQPVTGVGHPSSTDCSGSNNATLTIAIREADLRTSSSGFYSDSLVLLVEPE